MPNPEFYQNLGSFLRRIIKNENQQRRTGKEISQAVRDIF